MGKEWVAGMNTPNMSADAEPTATRWCAMTGPRELTDAERATVAWAAGRLVRADVRIRAYGSAHASDFHAAALSGATAAGGALIPFSTWSDQREADQAVLHKAFILCCQLDPAIGTMRLIQQRN